MKTLICLVFLALFTATHTNGQTIDSTIQKLLIQQLIAPEQEGDLRDYLSSRQAAVINTDYLVGLYRAEVKKIIGRDAPVSSDFFKFNPAELSDSAQKEVNRNLAAYLIKLKNCGLVSDKQFNTQSEKISSSAYVHVIQLLPALAKQNEL